VPDDAAAADEERLRQFVAHSRRLGDVTRPRPLADDVDPRRRHVGARRVERLVLPKRRVAGGADERVLEDEELGRGERAVERGGVGEAAGRVRHRDGAYAGAVSNWRSADRQPK
jgi:hypothetical protein